MKLEYIADGSNYAPLVRLYDFTLEEVTTLKAGIERLASGELTEADIQAFVSTEAISNCHLTFLTNKSDRGIELLRQPNEFACIMSIEGWLDMSGLIEPFLIAGDKRGHYQWITGYQSYIEIPLLLSVDGSW